MTSTIEFTEIRLEHRGRARRPREDALPEHLDYHDDGCTVFPSCLSCPLPRCRYDVPGGARAMLNVARDEAIRRMRDEGDLPVDEIANRFRVSRRTVFRVLTPRRPEQIDRIEHMGGAA
ncbi:MAG: helix-turn-helix domain-containing protein [Dehalococcoidia bacterium]|nr:helix-turn-helix domain-containing protein [Dehalococcoidia bacterium]